MQNFSLPADKFFSVFNELIDDFKKNGFDPEKSLIPVGKNTYGHPGSETLKRYFDRNITYYRADEENDVTFYVNTNEINQNNDEINYLNKQ